MARVYSVVRFFPEDPGHQCGYCKSENGFIAQGFWAFILNVEEYQNLIDRGWRRSGKYCYKPVMNKMCCPPYTIRCDAPEVRLTKSQRKIAKRMRNFLLHGKSREEEKDSHPRGDVMDGSVEHSHMELEIDASTLESMASRASGDLPQASSALLLPNRDGSVDVPSSPPAPAPPERRGEPDGVGTARADPPDSQPLPGPGRPAARPGEGADPMRPACRKQKQLRRERRRLKRGEEAVGARAPPAPVPLEELLAPPDGAKHRLEVRLVASAPPSDEYVRTKPASFLVYKQYQMVVHGDAEDKCTMSTYERFLGHSPLKEDPPCGSFHQQYWLDDELIAVGVLDVLPGCVSSKYFFYLPRYGFLSLGTYSSLRELALTRQLQKRWPKLRYYYMGYYIHSCPKMRYKGRLAPSFLLCPETYTWHAIETCLPMLDRHKYARLAPPAPPERPADLTSALVLYGGQSMRYIRYRQLTGARDDEEVAQYLRLVGARVASRTLLYRE